MSLQNGIKRSMVRWTGTCLLGASSLLLGQQGNSTATAPLPPPDTQDQSQAPAPSVNDDRVQATDPNMQGPSTSSPTPYPNQAPYPSQSPYPTQQSPYGSQPQYPAQQQYPAQSPYPSQPNGGQGQPSYGPWASTAPAQNAPIPTQLTINPGTYVTVRINQQLSSDKNVPGDSFTATLTDPVVVNGIVVAEPGQTLGGQVTEAVKAGRVEGTARLGVKLTDLTLADGQKIGIDTQFIDRRAGSTTGRDAGAIAGTTALGAAIGAAAGWGRGAAIGAGAGAAASTIGVLLTRGHASVIYPEQVLTFRIENAASFSTANAPQAFHYVQTGEYDRPNYSNAPPQMSYGAPPPPAYYGTPAPYYYGAPYAYPYYGPTVGVFFGRPYYRPYYYGRPYYGGRFYRR